MELGCDRNRSKKVLEILKILEGRVVASLKDHDRATGSASEAVCTLAVQLRQD